MKILSIDTSSNICSVALLEDNHQIQELNRLDSKTHSENLMPLIDQLFSATGLTLKDVECIVCDKGPGSFTGVRIGIATVKALAEVRNIPVIVVSSLEALAYQIHPEDGIICSLIDARNDQVYCGLFDPNHALLQDYLADHIETVIPILKQYPKITFVGDGSVLQETLLKSKLSSTLIFSGNIVLNATDLGICGYDKFKNGTVDTADSILPMYLRKSQAERMRESNGC